MATSNLQEQSQERLLSEAIAGRRATPSFDGSPVPDKVLSAVVHAGIEAPSGFNLQPWRFIVVRDAAQKRRLREAAMGQAKVEEAGAVIVCCGDLNAPRGQNLNDVLVESARHGFTEEQNRRMTESVNGVFEQPPSNVFGLTPDYAVWVNRHVMIALTTMMWMAEVLGYDTAPMDLLGHAADLLDEGVIVVASFFDRGRQRHRPPVDLLDRTGSPLEARSVFDGVGFGGRIGEDGDQLLVAVGFAEVDGPLAVFVLVGHGSPHCSRTFRWRPISARHRASAAASAACGVAAQP